MESILPLIAVRNGRELERGAIQQDEVLVSQGVHLLDLVAQFYVLSDGLIKVSHAWVLCSPATEKGVFSNIPYHLEAIRDNVV